MEDNIIETYKYKMQNLEKICIPDEFLDSIKNIIGKQSIKIIYDFWEFLMVESLNINNRKDIVEYVRNSGKKYEYPLILEKKQKDSLKQAKVGRLEYRKYKLNIKCIFIIYIKNNELKLMFTNTFYEDGDKKKGKNSYKLAIKKAILIFNQYVG